MQELTKVRASLLLLAAARGAVLWYAVEKIFLLHIGITVQQIVVLGMIAQGSKFFFELPTSVLADRWSRRNILLLAEIAMILCDAILGFSSSFWTYAAGVLVWSVSDALAVGVYEAFAYDSLAVNGHKSAFRKVYSRMRSIEFTTMAIVGILAGIAAHVINLRASFFLSIPACVLAIAVLLSMTEPTIHRSTADQISWLRHIGTAFKSMSAPVIRRAVMLYVGLTAFILVWYEYYQLIGAQDGLPLVVFGFLIAVLTVGMAFGSELAHKLPSSQAVLATAWGVFAMGHILLALARQAYVALLIIFFIFAAFQMLMVYTEVYLHDHIASERRATVFSLASTIVYLWFFLLAVCFSVMLKKFGASTAYLITSLPLVAFAVLDGTIKFRSIKGVSPEEVQRLA